MAKNDEGSGSSSDKSESEEDNDDGRKKRRRTRCCGIILQAIAIIANILLWGMAVFSIIYGIVVGLSTRTIGADEYNILDWVILTPATVFLYYGIPMLVVATWGWFATVSAHPVNLIIYVVLIILLILYDVIFAICIMFCANAYKRKLLDYLYDSIPRWGEDDDTKRIGIIITIHPTKYWNHLQNRGKCCGFYDYDDWKNNTVTKRNASLPDACCNENFQHKGCGFLAWRHPDREQHTMESIIHDRGCLSIFPSTIQNDDGHYIWGMGFFLLIILIIAIIFSVWLWILVVCCAYRRPTGLNNPDVALVPVQPSLLSTKSARVHPERDDESRDRRISFGEKPSYIADDDRRRRY